MKRKRKGSIPIDILYLPALVLLTVFVIYPLISGVQISFTNWNGYSSKYKYVGLANYVKMFHDKMFYTALKNTFIYGVGSTTIQTIVGVAYALLLQKRFHGQTLTRVIVYLPAMIASLIMGYISYFLVQYNHGAINNTIPVCQALEIEDPKAAAVCAVEVLNPSMQPTLDAASLAIMSQRGQFKGITVDGPLALDNALNEDAARHKGIKSPVAGHADVLLMPNIECGNIMWKTLVYMARCEIAGVLMGAAAPVVITSRSDAPETKLNSIALALLIAGNKDKK